MDGAAGAAKLDEGAGLGEYVGFEDVSYGTLADFESKDEAELRQMTSAESGWLSELRPPLPHAAVDASEPVVAPSQPWSGASRSLPRRSLLSLPVFDTGVTLCFIRQPEQQLGIRLVLQTPASKQRGAKAGARVATVDYHCLAWRAGLQAGDLITTITCAGERTVISDSYQAHSVLGAANGTIELEVRRRRWTETDFAATSLQAAWRGTAVRIKIYDFDQAALVLQEHWRDHAVRRRRMWELAAVQPAILASARLSSYAGSSRDSSVRWSKPCSQRDSSGSSTEHSQSGSSQASRRDSFAYRE